jgi:hypothetical protein
MKAYKVTFEDGNTLATSMNATLDEARAYYVGQSFEHDELKPMVKAVAVECAHANVDEYFQKCDDCGAALEAPEVQ